MKINNFEVLKDTIELPSSNGKKLYEKYGTIETLNVYRLTFNNNMYSIENTPFTLLIK